MDNVTEGPVNVMTAEIWNELLQTWGHEEVTASDGSEERYITLPATETALAQEYVYNWDTFQLEPGIEDYPN